MRIRTRVADLAAGCWARQPWRHSRRRPPAWPSPAQPAPAACPEAQSHAGPRPGRRRHSPADFLHISLCHTQHGLCSIWHSCADSQTGHHRFTPAAAVLLGARLCRMPDVAWLSMASQHRGLRPEHFCRCPARGMQASLCMYQRSWGSSTKATFAPPAPSSCRQSSSRLAGNAHQLACQQAGVKSWAHIQTE